MSSALFEHMPFQAESKNHEMEKRVRALEGGPKTAAPGATPAHSAGRKATRTVSRGRKTATATPSKTPAHAFLAGLDISQHITSARERARSHPGTMDLCLLLKNLDLRQNGEVIGDGLGRVTDVTPLPDQFKKIVSQLDKFLKSEDIVGALECITSKNLEEKIKEVSDKPMTFQSLKQVVTTILGGIFCGEGNLFYIQVRSTQNKSEYRYPSTKTENTFQYTLTDSDIYTIDIKDLSGIRYTPNLYAYESDGNLVTPIENPFNLTYGRPCVEIVNGREVSDYLAYGVRLYAFQLDAEDKHLELTLTNDTRRTVLKLQFDYRSAR